jgi:DNA integrity scanning protein DisA with diadenylate cyclase activity|tara:strand:+ start:324 stop:587 length:264 start_codon:yes stop_codon:yes gene_type:complete
VRNYIYKTLIAVIALIVVFEFTIGKTLNKITKQTDILLTKEGRKQMVNSVKIEMEKAVKKENYLKKDERILINKFINKVKNELNTAE